jgi:hypothetical protein
MSPDDVFSFKSGLTARSTLSRSHQRQKLNETPRVDAHEAPNPVTVMTSEGGWRNAPIA